MCWVIKIGARSIAAPICPIKVVSACGPPVEDPISNTRGRQRANGRRLNAAASACGGTLSRSRGADSGRLAMRARPALARQQAAAAAKVADFLDQLALERRRHAGIGRGLGLWNIIGGAERQRPQADLGAPPRQRRGHDHHQIALLLQQQRQRRNAVKLRHVDVEDDDVRIMLLRFDRPPRVRCAGRRRRVMSGSASIQRVNRRRATIASSTIITRMRRPRAVDGLDLGGADDTHGTGTFNTQLGTRTFTNATRGRELAAQISPTSWNLASTMSLSNGFMMYSLAPACSARAMWATSFSVVQNTTFGLSPPGKRRSTRRNS